MYLQIAAQCAGVFMNHKFMGNKARKTHLTMVKFGKKKQKTKI